MRFGTIETDLPNLTRLACGPKVADASEKPPFHRRANQKHRKILFMGDKSPKAVNKQATQKQSKANAANQAKKQAEMAKSTAAKKR